MYFNNDKALRVVKFIECLKHCDGEWYGKPFKLLPWQHEQISAVFGTQTDDDIRQYQFVYSEIPKKNGKALWIDTPIPTPNGWNTMGNLKVGDEVFDENGEVCKITFITDTMYDHKCYKVEFSDNTSIIADEEHFWVTNAWVDKPNTKRQKNIDKLDSRYDGSIRRKRTTKELFETLKTKSGGNNHSIECCRPLKLDDLYLQIPPYTLGAWLGDGSSQRASIVCQDSDYEIIEYIKEDGIPIQKYKSNNRISEYGFTTGERTTESRNNSIQSILRKKNILNNKHIPYFYLRASEYQRMELLKGLMDTDGYVSKKGQCEFTTVNKKLCDSVMELLRTLGYKPSLKVGDAMLYGKNCGEKYRIQFWAYKDKPCFKLKRKIERLKDSKTTRSSVRHITNIFEVESVPVKCIQVDSKNHMYLAGESFIPTHNTELGAAIALYMTFADGEKRGEVYGCAAEKQQASIAFDVAVEMIEQNPTLKKRTKMRLSKKELEDKISGTRYKVLSAEAYSKHGFKVSACIFDELHAQPSRELWDIMTFGAGDARLQPLWWVITTAGDDPDRHSIGWEIHEKAQKIIDGEIIDPRWYAKIYGIPQDYEGDIFDEELWYKVNPSLGHSIDISKLRQAAIGARNNEAEEKLFRWLRLNQWISLKGSGWIDLTLWDKTVGEWNPAELLGKKCYAGLDLSSTTDLTGITLLFPPQKGLNDWRFVSEGFIPEENMKERMKRDKAPFDKWVREKFITATAGNAIDYDIIQSKIELISKQYDLQYLCVDPWNSRMLTQNLDKLGIETIEVNQTMANMSPAMKEIERLMKTGQMTHERNPAARWCMGNVITAVDGNGNIKPMKNKSKDRIDLTVSLINAMAIGITQENMRSSVYENRGMRSL